PGLLTVDDEAVAVADGPGADGTQVGSRAGFGQRDRLEVADAQVADDLFLLRFGAMPQIRLRSGQSGAVGMDRCLTARGLLQEDALLAHPRSASTVVDGNRHAKPAEFGELLQQVWAVGQPLRQLRALLGGGAVVGAESLDRGGELALFDREHAQLPRYAANSGL